MLSVKCRFFFLFEDVSESHEEIDLCVTFYVSDVNTRVIRHTVNKE